MYVGRLDGWKGAQTLCEAAQFLSDTIQVIVVGGEPHQVESFKSRYPKILFLGFVPYEKIAHIQAAADVLVLPNTGKDAVSQKFTSPLKLFTYMASGKPIVASDLPSIREVLDDQACYFVTPDDVQALAQGVEHVLRDTDAAQKAARAKTLVTSYTWDMRAQKILAAIQSYAR
jgi:glycosyltransferase involved in cell wall biosynthesis